MNKINPLAAGVAAAVLLSAAFMFSQDVAMAKKEDLQVPPPSFTKFDASLTQSMVNIFNSAVMGAQREISASEIGGYTIAGVKISCFTTDRSLEEVSRYFAEKLGQEAEIETDALAGSLEEMKEMEKLTGLSWDKSLMAKFQKASEEYMGEESRTAGYDAGHFPERVVSIEIQSPYLDLSSFKKVNKTSIMYMVITLKKK